MRKQEEREAAIMAWAGRVIPALEEMLEKGEVEGQIHEGELLIRVAVESPLEGRPGAHGLLHIKVTREALTDYLLADKTAVPATQKFLAVIQEKQESYVLIPSEDIWADPKPEVWLIRSEDVRIW
jgi:hypothetical protein